MGALVDKSKTLGLLAIKASRTIRNHREYSLADQLLRSGTSVGANIREATQGQSDRDFVSKLQIALKECVETEYWLELLRESEIYEDNDMVSVCGEVKAMLTSSIKTVKNRHKNEKN